MVHTDTVNRRTPNVRQTVGFLFMVIAGNFVSDFMKQAYDILYHHPSVPNSIIIGCAAAFIFKQVTDCYLYYQDFVHFEPRQPHVPWREYLWWGFYNLIEIQVLLFTFGGVTDLMQLDAKTGSITILAIRRFVAAAALVEVSWLTWDIVFVLRHMKKHPRRRIRTRLHDFISDPDGTAKCTRRWLPLNTLWSGCMALLWRYLQHVDTLNWEISEIVLAVFVAYIVTHGIVLKDYYCGIMYSSPEPHSEHR